MAERVDPWDVTVSWEPNAPEAVLLSNDTGVTVLAMRANPSDADGRCVVLRWDGTSSASIATPNDEALPGHRLWDRGLEGLLWGGIVHDSDLVRELELQNEINPNHDATRFALLRHHVVVTKERIVEVAARSLTVERHEGPTAVAAVAASSLRGPLAR